MPRLLVLCAILTVCITAYMTLGARGAWGFVLPFRGVKLAGLLLVAFAVSTSTVLFQTITQNRILTPSIMGFDALYVLILTVLVFALGGQDYVRMPALGQFILNLSLLIGASLLLFGTLLTKARQDLMRMLLTGIVLGVFFRSLSSFLQRIIDPNEYAVIQAASFARFTRIDTDLLLIASCVTLAALLLSWRMRHTLDVLELGHDTTVNLGEDPQIATLKTLAIIAALVSVSTALVGPVVFLGLLTVSLTHLVMPSAKHALLLPAAALVCAITLVGGQTILERVLGFATPLSAVIDIVGGILFLGLLLKGLSR